MSDTPTRVVTSLKKTVADQKDSIATLVMRISSLSDDVKDLKHDLLKLRQDVGEDLKDLYKRTRS